MFPKGFKVLGVHSGITKNKKKKDLGVFYSDLPARAAAVFTVSGLRSAAIKFSGKNLNGRPVQAIVANSGCANTCTGSKGLLNAGIIAREAAKGLNISFRNVLLASTGVIGTHLPVNKILVGLRKITKDIYFHNRSFPSSGAEAIMTTDTQKKISARSFKISNRKINIWGCAKGAGMIHPNMATMLCFVLTDASVPMVLMKKALKLAADDSFNSLSIDGETSPNDTVYLLANGASGVNIKGAGSAGFKIFQRQLSEVCSELGRKIVEDGEGARKFFNITVSKAASLKVAKCLSGLIATSPLVKTAFAGGDANWGRIMAVIGRSGLGINPDRVSMYFNDVQIVKDGVGVHLSRGKLNNLLTGKHNDIEVVVNQGKTSARYQTCDMTEMYVRINADFLT